MFIIWKFLLQLSFFFSCLFENFNGSLGVFLGGAGQFFFHEGGERWSCLVYFVFKIFTTLSFLLLIKLDIRSIFETSQSLFLVDSAWFHCYRMYF